MAIGADRWSVLRLVLRQGLVLTAIGVVIGLALSSLAIKGMNALFNGDSLGIGIMLLMAAGMMVSRSISSSAA